MFTPSCKIFISLTVHRASFKDYWQSDFFLECMYWCFSRFFRQKLLVYILINQQTENPCIVPGNRMAAWSWFFFCFSNVSCLQIMKNQNRYSTQPCLPVACKLYYCNIRSDRGLWSLRINSLPLVTPYSTEQIPKPMLTQGYWHPSHLIFTLGIYKIRNGVDCSVSLDEISE